MTASEFQESAEANLVLYEAADGVATLTLNRPDRLNTIIPDLIGQLLAALDRAQADAGGARGSAAGSWSRLLRGLCYWLGRGSDAGD